MISTYTHTQRRFGGESTSIRETYFLNVVLRILVLELEFLDRYGLNSECPVWWHALSNLPDDTEGALPDRLKYFEFFL